MRQASSMSASTCGAPADSTLLTWLRVAGERLSGTHRQAPHVCEVNLNSSRLAFAFLCHLPGATYTGSFYGGWARHEELGHELNRSLTETFGSDRARISREDQWSRSVRGNPDLDGCDVLIFGADEIAIGPSQPFYADAQHRCALRCMSCSPTY